MTCACGDADCLHAELGYPWCRSCGEHHRPPECPVNEQGQSLAPDGRPWEDHDREYHARRSDPTEAVLPVPHRPEPSCRCADCLAYDRIDGHA